MGKNIRENYSTLWLDKTFLKIIMLYFTYKV